MKIAMIGLGRMGANIARHRAVGRRTCGAILRVWRRHNLHNLLWSQRRSSFRLPG